MRFIHRVIEKEILKASRSFPALILTGPRRSGKTTLFRRLFPKASYHLLEDPDLISQVRSDPRSFVNGLRAPAILDEIQNIPEILNYLRTRIDKTSPAVGSFLLTGSQEAPLMRGVTESMAGRAAVFQLYPLSCEESNKVELVKGGFPEVLARASAANIWFRSYIQTYLERDIRAVSSIRDLATFRRFLSLLASRTGQVLNRTDLAAPLGVSIPTVSEWINILETTSQIIIVPPYFENFGKRIIKSPKIYFMDSGLVCYLLDIRLEPQLIRSPFLGPLFEGFVASEIVKHQVNRGRRKEIYYFRDQQGLEVDFLVPKAGNGLTLFEVKAGRTVTPEAAGPMTRLASSIKQYKTQSFVVHRGAAESKAETMFLGKAARGVSFSQIGDVL